MATLFVLNSKPNVVPMRLFPQPQRIISNRGPSSNKHLHRKVLHMAAQGGNNENPPQETPDPLKAELNLLLSLIVSYPAVRGSIAVALGFLTHIDPLGTLRWDSHDALVGCSLAILPALLDVFILLPNWEPEKTTRTMKLKVPRAVAEKIDGEKKILEIVENNNNEISSTSSSSSSAMESSNSNGGDDIAPTTTTTTAATATASPEPFDEPLTAAAATALKEKEKEAVAAAVALPDLVEIERVMTVRATQSPLRDALLNIQTGRVMSNIGRSLSVPSEAALLLLVHVSEEMLYRGVLLVAFIKWCTDNLYLAGVFDETLNLGGGVELALPQVKKYFFILFFYRSSLCFIVNIAGGSAARSIWFNIWGCCVATPTRAVPLTAAERQQRAVEVIRRRSRQKEKRSCKSPERRRPGKGAKTEEGRCKDTREGAQWGGGAAAVGGSS